LYVRHANSTAKGTIEDSNGMRREIWVSTKNRFAAVSSFTVWFARSTLPFAWDLSGANVLKFIPVTGQFSILDAVLKSATPTDGL
jgi:hypothetical protein